MTQLNCFRRRNPLNVGLALVATLGLAQTVQASLILQSAIEVTGTGLGTEPTILTIQNNPTETGCVSFSNIGASFSGASCTGSSGDVKTGASQTSIQPLSAIGSGITGSNFAIVFNADQPAGGAITLTGLTASFYSPTGTLLYQTNGFSCSTAGVAGCAFPSTVHGIGGSGFVFQLDAAQAAAATAAGVFLNQNDIVGLSASTSGASGGPETFYLGKTAGSTSSVPEPTTMFLMGTGLLGVLLFSRRRKSSFFRQE
jgi:hypothetical protein